MSAFERAFRRRVGDLVATGYRDLPQSRTQMITLLLAHVRALGCDCNPDITLPVTPQRGSVTPIGIAHDDWCALLRRLERAR